MSDVNSRLDSLTAAIKETAAKMDEAADGRKKSGRVKLFSTPS